MDDGWHAIAVNYAPSLSCQPLLYLADGWKHVGSVKLRLSGQKLAKSLRTDQHILQFSPPTTSIPFILEVPPALEAAFALADWLFIYSAAPKGPYWQISLENAAYALTEARTSCQLEAQQALIDELEAQPHYNLSPVQ